MTKQPLNPPQSHPWLQRRSNLWNHPLDNLNLAPLGREIVSEHTLLLRAGAGAKCLRWDLYLMPELGSNPKAWEFCVSTKHYTIGRINRRFRLRGKSGKFCGVKTLNCTPSKRTNPASVPIQR